MKRRQFIGRFLAVLTMPVFVATAAVSNEPAAKVMADRWDFFMVESALSELRFYSTDLMFGDNGSLKSPSQYCACKDLFDAKVLSLTARLENDAQKTAFRRKALAISMQFIVDHVMQIERQSLAYRRKVSRLVEEFHAPRT